jgi:hypothetical protein
MAMGSDVKSLRDEMTWLIGHVFPKRTVVGNWARLVLLPIIAVAGLAAWTMLPGRSGAESQREPAPSPAILSTSDTSWLNPAVTPTQATLATPADAAAPEEMGPQPAPIDGLKISSQSWRRGGLGSKALITFTLRNGNYYPVRDIEISCAFTRRDGSHLTDRTRLIHDTVDMKSRKTFARMHVGFVNINASKAKCSLVTAQALQATDTSQEAATARR